MLMLLLLLVVVGVGRGHLLGASGADRRRRRPRRVYYNQQAKTSGLMYKISYDTITHTHTHV